MTPWLPFCEPAASCPTRAGAHSHLNTFLTQQTHAARTRARACAHTHTRARARARARMHTRSHTYSLTHSVEIVGTGWRPIKAGYGRLAVTSNYPRPDLHGGPGLPQLAPPSPDQVRPLPNRLGRAGGINRGSRTGWLGTSLRPAHSLLCIAGDASAEPECPGRLGLGLGRGRVTDTVTWPGAAAAAY